MCLSYFMLITFAFKTSLFYFHITPFVSITYDFAGMDDPDSRTEIIKIKTKADGKQTVGIRTDITFEVTNSKNGTKPNQDGRKAESDSDEDAEVPIFRGTDESNNRDSFHRRYDSRHIANNRPMFQRTNDDVIQFDRSGSWVNFVPVTWTTERNYEQNLIQQSECELLCVNIFLILT